MSEDPYFFLRIQRKPYIHHGVPKALAGADLLVEQWTGSIVLIIIFDENLYYDHYPSPFGYLTNLY